jgi:tRNA (guanine-N(7)-)-methyltransferase subunit TRM82
MTYSPSEKVIIIADKTGDLYSFPWPLSAHQQTQYQATKLLPSPDDKTPLTKPTDARFMGTFLLGHSSSVGAVSLAETKWGRVLVSGDRDEHVRISVWPETWVIWGMGMGHTAFVSCVVGVDGGVVTGGGDCRVIRWDFEGVKTGEYTVLEGSCVRLVRVWREFIVVVGERFVALWWVVGVNC